jgi:5-oxoprolinase (ATP-hydrolysing)
MRAALHKLGDGVYRFEDRMDDDTTIRLAVTIRDETAAFDFTGTDPVHPGNFNANRAIVTSAVLYCLRCLIDDDIPLNAGVLAPVEIILPRCFLNPQGNSDPRKCPAVAAGNVETSQRIVDCLFGALGMVTASQGTMNNLLMGNERFGYYETICGGAGAGPTFDGADAVHTNMTNTRLTDPEVLESRYPVRLHRFQIRQGSGGAGRFHGGCGVIREFEFLEPLDVSLITQRRLVAPYGLHGGRPGSPGRNKLIRAAVPAIDNRQSPIDNIVVLPPIASISVQPGDRLIIETPGGGGWGPPNAECQMRNAE